MFLGTEDQVFSRRFAGRRGVPRIADLEPTDSFPFKRPVFTHSTRFRRIIILILRKSRDAHFHSPIHRRVTPSIVIPSRKFLFLFFSFVRESSFSRFVVPAGASGQDRDRWKGSGGGGGEGGRIEKTREISWLIRDQGGRGWERRKRAKKRDDEQPTGPFKVPRRQQRASNELIKLSNSFELASERANKCSPLPRGPLHRFRAPSVQL